MGEHKGQETVKRSVFGIPLLIALGILANYLNVPLMSGVNLVFGSIFALVAVDVFGVAVGVIAAALISSYTMVLWGHPYGILLAATEAVSVGLLSRWTQKDLAIRDIVFWAFLGIPQIWFCYHYPFSGLRRS